MNFQDVDPNVWWDNNWPYFYLRDVTTDPKWMHYFGNSRDIFYCPSGALNEEEHWPSFVDDVHWGYAYMGPTRWSRRSKEQPGAGIAIFDYPERMEDKPELPLFVDFNVYNEGYNGYTGFERGSHPAFLVGGDPGRYTGLEPEGRNLLRLGGDVNWLPFESEEQLRRFEIQVNLFIAF